MGESGINLCQYLNDQLSKSMGHHWHCFIDAKFSAFSFTEGAYFEHRGLDWVVFKTEVGMTKVLKIGSSTGGSKNDLKSIRNERYEFKK